MKSANATCAHSEGYLVRHPTRQVGENKFCQIWVMDQKRRFSSELQLGMKRQYGPDDAYGSLTCRFELASVVAVEE